jgi:hypothetical protein
LGIPEILALGNGGVVGAILAVVAIVGTVLGGIVFKNKAVVSVTDKEKLVDSKQLDLINSNLGEIEKRLGNVEHDVTSRATREEVHRLELSFTRMEGRFDGVSATTQATANAVSRIEQFMYDAALRAKGDH